MSLWGCGERGSVVHKSTGPARVEAGHAASFPLLCDQGAVGPVAGPAPGAVEEGQRLVRVLVHPHLGLDIVGSGGARWQLERTAVVTVRVVVADDALLLAAEDVADLLEAGRYEGAGGLLGGLGEADVLVGQADLAEEAVCLPSTVRIWRSRSAPRATLRTVASGLGGFPLNESNQREQGADHEYRGAQVNWPKMTHPIVLKDPHVMHRQSHHQADDR